MSFSYNKKQKRPSELAAQDIKEENLQTFSFTEAVRKLDLDRLKPPIEKKPVENFSRARGNFSAVMLDRATEYEALRNYIDDHLEGLRLMQIEHTLQQYCGLANDGLDDTEEQMWDPAVENVIYGNYRGVDYRYPNYCDDLVQNNNIDCFTRYERESLYKQHMKYKSICKQATLRQHESVHSASQNHYEQHPISMFNMETSHLKELDAKQEQDNFEGKRRLCRHFLKGRCNRGKSCDFLHDESIFCSDEQKVFLGGLPTHITDKELRDALRKQGYTVLNKPKVLQGFSPQICLGSVQEAQSMIKRGNVMIEGEFVDVRPYEAFAKDNVKIGSEEETKRSVFLGGLSSSTTGWMIKKRLAALGFVTANHPVVKSGFAPQVMLESAEQARRLVKLKNIKINKSTVEVRPYSRYRVKFRTKKQLQKDN